MEFHCGSGLCTARAGTQGAKRSFTSDSAASLAEKAFEKKTRSGGNESILTGLDPDEVETV